MIVAGVSAPCCPPLCCAPGCCGTICCGAGGLQPACPVEQLTISSSPDPSAEGQKVTISGKLTNASAHAVVYLWQQPIGQSSFRRVAQTTTDASGDYTFVLGAGVVETNGSWYASTTGATSSTVFQRVGADVRFVTWVVAGALLTLNGHVSPSHPGERIWLQRYTPAKRWDTVASSLIGRLSGFTVRHRFARSGSVLLRAVFGGDTRNIRSTSPPLRIFVH
jgi:hypothetical protein